MSTTKSNFSLSFFVPSFEKFKNLFKSKSNETHKNDKSNQSTDFLRHDPVRQLLKNSYHLPDLFSIYSTNIQPCNLCPQCYHFNQMINNEMLEYTENRRSCSEFSSKFVEEDSGIQDIDMFKKNLLKNQIKNSFDLHSYQTSRSSDKQNGILIKNDRLNSVRSKSSGRTNDPKASKSKSFHEKISNFYGKSYSSICNSKPSLENHHRPLDDQSSLFFVPQKSFNDTTPVVYNFDQYGVNTDLKTPDEAFKYNENCHGSNRRFQSLRGKKLRQHERHYSRRILNTDEYHVEVMKLRRAHGNDAESFWLPIQKNISNVCDDSHSKQIKNCYDTPSTSSLSLLTPHIDVNKSASFSSSPYPFNYPHHKSPSKHKTSKSISSRFISPPFRKKGVYLKGLCRWREDIAVDNDSMKRLIRESFINNGVNIKNRT